ncbi:hypothetical protein ACP4OV_014678 [Aristida adscensionis]
MSTVRLLLAEPRSRFDEHGVLLASASRNSCRPLSVLLDLGCLMASIGKKLLVAHQEEELPVANKLPVNPLAPRLPLLQQNNAKPDDLVINSDKSSLSGLPVKTKLVVVHVSDDDDDDCVVLDGNPDKEVSAAKLVGSVGDGSSDEDELQITHEKGELACRDFPHPRHLCFSHPFSATPHEMYCHMCHCFVCDIIPAPCKYWGDGASTIGHCHATDKDPTWINLRQAFRDMFKYLNSSDGTQQAEKSGPEIHRNVINSSMIAPSKLLESMTMEGHGPVPQPPPSPIPNRFLTLREYQNQVMKQRSQNQRRHPSNMRPSRSVAGSSMANQIQNSQANQQYKAPRHASFNPRKYITQVVLRVQERQNNSTAASAPQKKHTDAGLGHNHTDKPREVINKKVLGNKLHSSEAEGSNNQSQQTNPTSPRLTDEDYNLQESSAAAKSKVTALPAKNLMRRNLKNDEKNKNRKAQNPSDKARLAK